MVFAGATSGMYGGDRVRPVPGAPSAAAAASVGLPSEGRGEAAARSGEVPTIPAADGRSPWPLYFLPRLLPAHSHSHAKPSGPARRRRALELRIGSCHSADSAKMSDSD